jgi:hypothetical protein
LIASVVFFDVRLALDISDMADVETRTPAHAPRLPPSRKPR